MFMVILLAALSTVAIASTIAAVRNDGYHRTPTDWSRLSLTTLRREIAASRRIAPATTPSFEVAISRRYGAAVSR